MYTKVLSNVNGYDAYQIDDHLEDDELELSVRGYKIKEYVKSCLDRGCPACIVFTESNTNRVEAIYYLPIRESDVGSVYISTLDKYSSSIRVFFKANAIETFYRREYGSMDPNLPLMQVPIIAELNKPFKYGDSTFEIKQGIYITDFSRPTNYSEITVIAPCLLRQNETFQQELDLTTIKGCCLQNSALSFGFAPNKIICYQNQITTQIFQRNIQIEVRNTEEAKCDDYILNLTNLSDPASLGLFKKIFKLKPTSIFSDNALSALSEHARNIDRLSELNTPYPETMNSMYKGWELIGYDVHEIPKTASGIRPIVIFSLSAKIDDQFIVKLGPNSLAGAFEDNIVPVAGKLLISPYFNVYELITENCRIHHLDKYSIPMHSISEDFQKAKNAALASLTPEEQKERSSNIDTIFEAVKNNMDIRHNSIHDQFKDLITQVSSGKLIVLQNNQSADHVIFKKISEATQKESMHDDILKVFIVDLLMGYYFTHIANRALLSPSAEMNEFDEF